MLFKSPLMLILIAASPVLHAQERTWVDSTGKYEVVGSLVEVTDEGVLLKKADGDTKLIPLNKLSKNDRATQKSMSFRRSLTVSLPVFRPRAL